MSAATSRRPTGLGRGLSALLGDVQREEPVGLGGERRPGIANVAVAQLTPHPDQPRRHFDDGALDELAASIAARGVIQPIVVRPHGNGYQIVAGERRWRAAQRAGLHEVPAIVREFDEAETLEIAIIENIQREELNAIEEAEAYRRLINDYGHTQDVLARLVHKSRSHVANLLRLLDLPEAVRAMVAEGELSMGHARALATAPEPEVLARQVAAKGMSVRDAERLARAAKGGSPRAKRDNGREADADVAALERHIGDLLGLKVSINDAGGGKGSMTLAYSTLDQLDMLCQRLSGEPI